MLGLSVSTLKNRRYRNTGPPFVRIGRSVLYDQVEISRSSFTGRYRS